MYLICIRSGTAPSWSYLGKTRTLFGFRPAESLTGVRRLSTYILICNTSYSTIHYVIYMYFPQVNPSRVWVRVWVFRYPSKDPYPFERVRVFAGCGCGYNLWYPEVYPCRSLVPFPCSSSYSCSSFDLSVGIPAEIVELSHIYGLDGMSSRPIQRGMRRAGYGDSGGEADSFLRRSTSGTRRASASGQPVSPLPPGPAACTTAYCGIPALMIIFANKSAFSNSGRIRG